MDCTRGETRKVFLFSQEPNRIYVVGMSLSPILRSKCSMRLFPPTKFKQIKESELSVSLGEKVLRGKRTNSRRCRSCHSEGTMTLSEKPLMSRVGKITSARMHSQAEAHMQNYA